MIGESIPKREFTFSKELIGAAHPGDEIRLVFLCGECKVKG